jgi:hypothetical protein
MELQIEDVQLPEQIKFNFEELKSVIQAKAHEYEVSVYTEDTIKEAKADRASLNKLKKALNDERIRREKAYMKPFNEFKAQVNELIGLIDKPILAIDTQIKGYEDSKKDEKRQAILEMWDKKDKPEFLGFDRIYNPKWLNATISLKKIEEDMDLLIATVKANLDTLDSLPEFGFEAKEVYKTTLDLQRAIAEGQRLADIQKRKEEAERQKAELEKAMKEEEEHIQNEPVADNKPVEVATETPYPPTEPIENASVEVQRAWVGFKAYLSKEEARKLGQFLDENNITIKKIEL